MRIKLIYPSSRKCDPKARWWQQPKAHRYPGLGLLTIAALCPPRFEISIVDDDYDDIDYDDETDLVGISVLTVNAHRAYEIARNFGEKRTPVVLGGMHVSACPSEASQHADSIVLGEAEDTWPNLLADFSLGKLKKMYKSMNNATLAGMPFPRRDLLDNRRYITVNHFVHIDSLSWNPPLQEIGKRRKAYGERLEQIQDFESLFPIE